jgi:hypothetical protein
MRQLLNGCRAETMQNMPENSLLFHRMPGHPLENTHDTVSSLEDVVLYSAKKKNELKKT